ncbi:MAG: vWA domain-containing protein [Thiotrichales bacterium]
MARATPETRLEAARTRLILDKPFLGALVLRLPMVAADPGWCPTTATDARKFYYNPGFIDALANEQVQFVLAHEALHCALSHFARRGHRIKKRWDIACDYAINPLLIDDGLKPPQSSLILAEFRGMTAEEIYPCIDESEHQEPLDKHVYDQDTDSQGGQRQNSASGDQSAEGRGQGQSGQAEDSESPEQSRTSPEHRADGSGGGIDEQRQGSQQDQAETGQGAPQPDPLSQQEIETLSTQWQQRLVGAAQQAKQAGKLGGAMARMIDFMVQPSLPWRMMLAQHVTSIARDDYSYLRPSSRRGDPAVFPSLRSAQLNIAAAVDVSGSMSEKEIGEFLSEIDAIKAQIRSRVTLYACDAELQSGSPWVFEPWEEVSLDTKIRGGGGTSFCPPIEHQNQADLAPDVLVYFTDAEGKFPEQEPAYPVVWLVKGKASVPWGQRIQLN